jgi:hypothetical protein
MTRREDQEKTRVQLRASLLASHLAPSVATLNGVASHIMSAPH